MPEAPPPPPLRSHDAQIAENAWQLLEAMPPTSPLRRNIVEWLSREMSTWDAAKALGVSHTLVWRARNNEVDWLVTMTIHPGLHRDRVDQEDVDFFMSVLDNVAPYASGRLYREQTVTNCRLYEIYLEECNTEGQQPLSLTFIQTQGTYHYSYQYITLTSSQYCHRNESTMSTIQQAAHTVENLTLTLLGKIQLRILKKKSKNESNWRNIKSWHMTNELASCKACTTFDRAPTTDTSSLCMTSLKSTPLSTTIKTTSL